jgi:hypothetical protein
MSRLIYKGGTNNNFGRHLPVPYIDRIEIANIEGADVTSIAVQKASPELLGTKLTFFVDLLFNTDDDFDIDTFKKEIFAKLDLHILLVADPTAAATLQDSKRHLKDAIRSLDAHTAAQMYGGTMHHEVLDLQLFVDSTTLTGDYDDDMNSVYRTVGLQVELQTVRLEDVENLTVFAGTSLDAAVLDDAVSSSDVAYAMNFSSFAFEPIMINHQLATKDQVAFFDEEEGYYAGVPLQAINKKYYKTEEFGADDIKRSLNAIMFDYTQYYKTDSELQSALSNIEFIYARYGEEPSFLTKLEKYRSMFPNRNSTTPTGNLYERYKVAIVNANTLLLRQSEVVKKLIRTTKIRDLRPFQRLTSAVPSYNSDLLSTDVLYPAFLHTNLAKYVEVDGATGGGDLPEFEAEIPVTPRETKNAFRAAMEDAIAQLEGVTGFKEYDSDFKDSLVEMVNNETRSAFISYTNMLKIDISDDGGWDRWNPHTLWLDYAGVTSDDWTDGLAGELNDITDLKWDLLETSLKALFNPKGAYEGDTRGHWKIDDEDVTTIGFYGATVPSGDGGSSGRIGPTFQFGLDLKNGELPFGTSYEEYYPVLSVDEAAPNFHSLLEVEGLITWYMERGYRFETEIESPGGGSSYMGDFWAPSYVNFVYDDPGPRLPGATEVVYTGDGPTGYEEVTTIVPSDFTDASKWTHVTNIAKRIIHDSTNWAGSPYDSPLQSMHDFYLTPETNPVFLQMLDNEEVWRTYTSAYDMTTAAGVSDFKTNLLNSMRTNVEVAAGSLPISQVVFRLRTTKGRGNGYWDYDRQPRSSACGGDWLWINDATAHEYSMPTCNGPGNVAIALGEEIVAHATDAWNDLYDQFVQLVDRLVDLLVVYHGIELSTGRWAKLARVDIVVQKYGWYFFDMEKYIRQQSNLSRFMDVPKFIHLFSYADDALNYSIRLAKTRYYTKHNFYDPMDPMYTYELALKLNSDADPLYNFPHFDSMNYKAISRTDSLYNAWHMKANPLDVASWKDFVTDGSGDVVDQQGSSGTSIGNTDIYSYVMLRNFDFPHDVHVPDNYRLMAFNYNYFVDDDFALLLNSDADGDELASSMVTIEDQSLTILTFFGEYMTSIYEEFISYYELAIENCAYNAYDATFNTFFGDYMNDKYVGNLQNAPWFKAPVLVSLYRDLFEDLLGGDKALILEEARKTADFINPTTGNLEALEQFKSDFESLFVNYEALVDEAARAVLGSVVVEPVVLPTGPSSAPVPTGYYSGSPWTGGAMTFEPGWLTTRHTYVVGFVSPGVFCSVLANNPGLPEGTPQLGTIYGDKAWETRTIDAPIIDLMGAYHDAIPELPDAWELFWSSEETT